MCNFIISRQNKKQKFFLSGKAKNSTELKSQRRNLILQNRESRLGGTSEINSPLKTQWAAISAARDFVGKKEKSFIVEYIYNYARTYFIKNS